MADQKFNNGSTPGCFKEAVCVDVDRIYDSCCERHKAPYQIELSHILISNVVFLLYSYNKKCSIIKITPPEINRVGLFL